MTRIAIYCRVSTSDQDTGTQRAILEKYARSNKWKFTTFCETESTRNTRPVKQQVMAALRSGLFSGVLIYKLDRWARSLSELLLEMKELNDKGITFISLTDNIDFSSAAGKLLASVIGAIAEFERSLISERTRAGLARKKEKGVRLGRPSGSKDKKPRKKSGYYIRELNRKKQ